MWPVRYIPAELTETLIEWDILHWNYLRHKWSIACCIWLKKLFFLQKHLSEDQWTKEATDHLFDLCRWVCLSECVPLCMFLIPLILILVCYVLYVAVYWFVTHLVGSLIFVSLSFMTALTMTNTRYVSVVLISQCVIKITLQRRSIEDLKEHYYSVCNRLNKVIISGSSRN